MIRKFYIDSYPAGLEIIKKSRKGNTKKIYRCFNTPGGYRTNEELNHRITRNRPWYAVQNDDYMEWDNGSYNKHEAIAMMKAHGSGQIAVINVKTNYCTEVIEYDEV